MSLKIDSEEQKTEVIKGTLAPTFGEQFEFSIKPSSRKLLKVIVYDWDQMSMSEFMGQVDIDLDDLESNKIVEEFYELGTKEQARERRKQHSEEKKKQLQQLEKEKKEQEKRDQEKKEQEDKEKRRQEEERKQKEEQAQLLKRKKKEEKELYLQSHPDERLRRKLQKPFKSYSKLILFFFTVLIAKRTKEFGALVAFTELFLL